MGSSTPTAAMLRAIELAEGVRGTTSPNPPVGCVILGADGAVVGAGATEPSGGAHAEIVALRHAGERAHGGTAVVTLEPCAHHGRTPPCVDALRAAGIAAVSYSVADPHPDAGGGAAALRGSGLRVEGGLRAEAVRRGPLRAWLHLVATGRPHVTWKYAATLDGRSAAADGSSRWISSPISRAQVHRLRAAADAVMAGTGTVLADDAQLAARDESGALRARQPLRVVVGRREPPSGARVLDSAARTVQLTSRDPDEVLSGLAARDVVDVLLEGGPTLAGAFLGRGRIDRVVAYLAPALLGSGPAALADAGVTSMAGVHRLSVEEVAISGPDIRISAIPDLREE